MDGKTIRKELHNENYWKRMNKFLVDDVPKFEAAFRQYIDRLKTMTL